MATILLQFKDLKQNGYVNNRTTLANRIKNDGFPEGRLLGPNTRVWTEDEVETWFKSRPLGKVLRSFTPHARAIAKNVRLEQATARRAQHDKTSPKANDPTVLGNAPAKGVLS